MKRVLITAIFSGMIFISNASAQSDESMKVENLNYYLSSIKDNISSMRYYTDSTKIINLLNELDALTLSIQSEIDMIVIPELEIVEEEVAMEEVAIEEDESTNDWTTEPEETENQSGGGLGLSKFMPFKNKFNTNFEIQFGINSLYQSTNASAGVLSPEINTGGSWYWDFALTRRAKLGGETSKVAVNYGISFLKNRFQIENDIRLTTVNGEPMFVAVENLRENPKLNIGYLTIPLGLSFSLSKKTNFKIGGYAGYRVHTVQKFHLKPSGETIHEMRYAGYQLNNWVYGATASLDIGGFDIIGRYSFSKLFKDNPNYDFNTFMIGTSFSLF